MHGVGKRRGRGDLEGGGRGRWAGLGGGVAMKAEPCVETSSRVKEKEFAISQLWESDQLGGYVEVRRVRDGIRRGSGRRGRESSRIH